MSGTGMARGRFNRSLTGPRTGILAAIPVSCLSMVIVLLEPSIRSRASPQIYEIQFQPPGSQELGSLQASWLGSLRPAWCPMERSSASRQVEDEHPCRELPNLDITVHTVQ